ncbi:permease, partial [candidate division KSB1 bacterium]|nr:permease [candidate division KSB1 bacterium]
MNWKEEYKKLLVIAAVFLLAYFLPVEKSSFTNAINESLALAKWYAREHVLLCLIPAFFIAGVISVFVSQASVIKYFGANAKKWLAYLVASVSGTILAVCSCTILPLFSSIHKRGAGLGPAIAFLYSGPAINILAIILTARILGPELGIARIVGAVVFSVVIGLIMHIIYRKEEKQKADAQLLMPESEETRPLWQTATHFFILVAILVFANWGKPADSAGLWHTIWSAKWGITAFFGGLFGVSLIFILKIRWPGVVIAGIVTIASAIIFKNNPLITFFVAILGTSVLISRREGEPQEWMSSTWDFAKQILPLLAAGVLVAGFLLGSPEGGQGIIPSTWISRFVGGNSIFSNFFASIVGAFMYFATLTEVPILQGLIANGMG